MRSTDDIHPERFHPLGPKVEKPAPAPASSSPAPQGPSGIVYDKDGRPSTTSHRPQLSPLEEAIWNWRQTYSDDALLDFLP